MLYASGINRRQSRCADREVEITLEVLDPTQGTMESGEGWVEVTFTVPVSHQPYEYDTGTSECWFVDGDITDEDGYIFDESDIDDMYIFCYEDEVGYDWSQVFSDAAEGAGDDAAEAQIERYEARHEY